MYEVSPESSRRASMARPSRRVERRVCFGKRCRDFRLEKFRVSLTHADSRAGESFAAIERLPKDRALFDGPHFLSPTGKDMRFAHTLLIVISQAVDCRQNAALDARQRWRS